MRTLQIFSRERGDWIDFTGNAEALIAAAETFLAAHPYRNKILRGAASVRESLEMDFEVHEPTCNRLMRFLPRHTITAQERGHRSPKWDEPTERLTICMPRSLWLQCRELTPDQLRTALYSAVNTLSQEETPYVKNKTAQP